MNRRLELLKIARQVFAEKGYESTTISEIVSRAGVAQGTFYLYFPSKVALVIALEEEMEQRIADAIRSSYQQSKRAEEMIEAGVRGAFRILAEYRDVLGVLHSGVSWADAIEERKRIFEPYYRLIAEIIRYQQTRHTVDAAINPDLTAVLIVGTVYYAADECYLYYPERDPEAYINETIGFILRALGNSPRD